MPDIFRSHRKKENSGNVLRNEPKTSVIGENNLPELKEGEDIHKIPGHSHNPLTSYYYYPDKVEFANKDPEEKVILFLRKHIITNLRWVLASILMAFLPAFFVFFSFFTSLPTGYQLVLTIIWYLLVFAFAFEKFLMWFFHVCIVTDERIIEVDFVNIFYREMSQADLDQVQDVTVEIGGPLRTYFNYGDIFIQTAAEIPRIDFEAVPKPDDVAKIIRDLEEKREEKSEGGMK